MISHGSTYVYDGSTDGLLTAFADSLRRGERAPRFVLSRVGENGWLFQADTLPADPATAKEICARILGVGGRDSLRAVVYAFLAEEDGFETPLYEFIRLTLERRRNVLGWKSNESIREVCRLSRLVGQEAHRFTGLLRFRELCDGALYADYAPDRNITMLLTRHFRERLSAERWVIHDRRRGLAVGWFAGMLCPIARVPENLDGLLAAEETRWQDLWRTFTRSISIGSRANPRLQRQLMPARYWEYLTEMQGPKP